jgi:hypothetical protein
VSVFILLLFVMILAISFLVYYYSANLHRLPREISWSFLHYYTRPWKWEYVGSKTSGYYTREYFPGGIYLFRESNYFFFKS